MPGSLWQRYIKCPFYKWDDSKNRIICEGLTEGGSVAVRFKTKEEFTLHMKTFCCQRMDYCEINRMLAALYDEDHG